MEKNFVPIDTNVSIDHADLSHTPELSVLSEKELVLERFASTPMAYEGKDGVYTAMGSYQAVILCEFLQNDKLPAAYLQAQFERAAALYLSLEANLEQPDVDDDEANVPGTIENPTHEAPNMKEQDNSAEPSSEPAVQRSSTDMLAPASIADNVEHPADTSVAIVTPPGDEPAAIVAESRPSREVVTYDKAPVDVADALPPTEDPPVIARIPLLPESEPNEQEILPSPEPIGGIEAEDVHEAVVEDVVFHAESLRPAPQEVPERVDDVEKLSDADEAIVLETSENESSFEVEPIYEDIFSPVEILETIPVDDLDTQEQHDSVIAPTLTIEDIGPLLVELQSVVHAKELVQDVSVTDEELNHKEIVSDHLEALAPLFQCIEAQIAQLSPEEYTDLMSENAELPRRITLALVDLFEAVGFEDPELALKVYIERYGVPELLDIVSEMPGDEIAVDTKDQTETPGCVKLARYVISTTLTRSPSTSFRGTPSTAA